MCRWAVASQQQQQRRVAAAAAAASPRLAVASQQQQPIHRLSATANPSPSSNQSIDRNPGLVSHLLSVTKFLLPLSAWQRLMPSSATGLRTSTYASTDPPPLSPRVFIRLRRFLIPWNRCLELFPVVATSRAPAAYQNPSEPSNVTRPIRAHNGRSQQATVAP
jgi:hypothetical protein